MNNFIKIGTICVMAVAALVFFPQQKSGNSQESDKIDVPQQDPESLSRRDFMRTKLMYSQNILEGLTTGDFDGIEKAIKDVQMVTAGAKWVAIDNEQYRELTRAFQSSTKQLMDAAKTKNIDATALRFYDMSTRCIDCHKHIRKAGYRL